MLEPKLQPIEAAQSDVFLRVKNCPNFQKTNFCTYHERSNFGIKKSTFFFGVENFATILQISISFLPLFYKNLRRGGSGPRWGLSSHQMDTFNTIFFNMRFFEKIWAKCSKALPFWSKHNADSQIDTNPGPTD